MAGYGQFCPVAKASEILAERWMPLVLRELGAGSHRFNDLSRGVPLMSRSLLAKRLRQLERAGVVERRAVSDDARAHEYHLTEAGAELTPVIEAIGAWGQRWLAADLDDDDLDPALLMWDLRRNVGRDARPDRRVVVRFEFGDVRGPRRYWWLLLEPDEADLCMTDPGFGVDCSLVTTTRALTSYWLGRTSWPELCRGAGYEFAGPPWIRRSLPKWLGRSPFAQSGAAR